MNPNPRKLYSVIRNIRSCFNLLKALTNDLHDDLGITASMRAVIETLAEEGEQTVPNIARTKGVSRQHIQVNVDALTKSSFVVLWNNPGHRRSPLVALTKEGKAAFKEMRRREQSVLEGLAGGLSYDSLEITLQTLIALKENLHQTTQKGAHHD